MLKKLIILMVLGMILLISGIAYNDYKVQQNYIHLAKNTQLTGNAINTIEKPTETKIIENTIKTETKTTIIDLGEEITTPKKEEPKEEIKEEKPEEPICEECQTEINIQGLTQGYLADYNGDTKEDLIRQEIDGKTYVYINIGTNETPIYEGGKLIE